MTIKTYDAAKVQVTWAGLILTGFAPDTFLSVERNVEGFTLQKGASGEGARSKSNDKSGKVTLTLLATSQSNDFLMAIAAADELTGAGVVPLFIKEQDGTTLVASQNSWVQKLPKVERGKESGSVEWVIECDDLEIAIGGLA